MKTRTLLIFALLIAVFAGWTGLTMGDDAGKEVDFEKIVCPGSKKQVNKDATVEHEDCIVYFCCNNCAAAFKKDVQDKKKFLARANHQKVATGQVKQTKCPKSFQGAKASTALEVNGVDVTFCCNNCRGWAEGLAKSADDVEDQIATLFGPNVFGKAFEVIGK